MRGRCGGGKISREGYVLIEYIRNEPKAKSKENVKKVVNSTSSTHSPSPVRYI